MKTFFTAKKAVCGLFMILFIFVVADYATSGQNTPPPTSIPPNIPPLSEIRTIMEEVVKDLKFDVDAIKEGMCHIAENSDEPLPEACWPCPCWTAETLRPVQADETHNYECYYEEFEGFDQTILKLRVNDCRYNMNNNNRTTANAQWMLYVDVPPGGGPLYTWCNYWPMDISEWCTDAKCLNYPAPGRMKRVDEVQIEACRALMNARIGELELLCQQE